MANAHPVRGVGSVEGAESGGTLDERIRTLAAAGPQKPTEEDGALARIPIEEIGPHPDQPRTVLNREKLKELKSSLVASGGVMTPIEVRPALPEELKAEPRFAYRLIAGQRRLTAYRELHEEARASERSQWACIKAIVKIGVDDAAALERAVIENIQREELLPLDEAEAYARIKQKRGLKTVREVAAAVSRKEDRVKDLLRLNEAPDVIKDALRGTLKVVRTEAAVEGGEPRERKETLRRLEVAEALKFMQLYEHYFEKAGGFASRGAPQKATEATRKAMERALADGWGTRRVDEYVKSVRAGRPETAQSSAPAPVFKSDARQLVVYRDRVPGASPEDRGALRQELQALLAQVDEQPQ